MSDVAVPCFSPLQMCVSGVDEKGQTVYFMPPNPVADPRAMTMTYDWVKHSELWDKRAPVGIPGAVPDSDHLMAVNWEMNARLGFNHDWKGLWGCEKGKVALVLSCGPSLPESLPTIRKLARDRKSYFTIGLNRTLTTYETDYYVISDRRGYPDWTADKKYEDTILIAAPTVAFHHPRKFVNRYWGEHFIRDLPDTGMTRLAAEMAITLCDTMHAAYKLGAREVWLYGCDYAMSGHFAEHVSEGGGRGFVIERYYHDMLAWQGMQIREHLFPRKAPVIGINGRLVFTNWELIAYAAYTATMAHMIENSGGVLVHNKTPCGILYETWRRDVNDICDPVRVCETPAAGS